jgi:hypothetical protein
VPGINVASSGALAGIMRLRNVMEVWPSDDATRAGKVDVRSTSGAPTITLDGQSGAITCVSLVQTSDRDAKENFSAINPREILKRISAMEISRWNFKQDTSAQHIGPMAQDFRAAFGTGSDDKHIATVDSDGVALAAIQGLNAVVQEKDEKIAAMEKRLAHLEQLVKSLASRKQD